jgi:hypothetical protein
MAQEKSVTAQTPENAQKDSLAAEEMTASVAVAISRRRMPDSLARITCYVSRCLASAANLPQQPAAAACRSSLV